MMKVEHEVQLNETEMGMIRSTEGFYKEEKKTKCTTRFWQLFLMSANEYQMWHCKIKVKVPNMYKLNYDNRFKLFKQKRTVRVKECN